MVLTVDFQFTLGSLSSPIKYGELAKGLGVQVGKRAESALVRDKVLALRASKGMVLDASDRDTFSTGSFSLTRLCRYLCLILCLRMRRASR